jgi:predicted DNA-binding protein with PD1-like motif
MSVRVHRSEQTRHLVLHVGGGESLLPVLAARLNDEQVASGWLRGSGLLADVELRAFDARLGRLGAIRRIAGPVHALSLESSIGLVDGAPAFSLRAVLAREGDAGLETLAGEIVGARAMAVEALVTALDDLTLGRSADDTGIALLDASDRGAEPAVVATVVSPSRSVSSIPPARSPAASPGGWSNALEASTQTERDASAQARAGAVGAPMPQRPARPGKIEVDAPVPEPGDVVDHFAFGRCDVIKSDGDRLHLRVHKDGRIREIALEMLRVTRLDDPAEAGMANLKSDENNPPARRFKLERRI